MKKITCQQIRDALKFKLKLVKPNRIWLFDKHYCAVNKDEFKDILKEVEPIKVKYQAELFDCEDYAHVLSAFVKLKAASSYSYGIAFGEITGRDTLLGNIHTLNFLITESEEAFYFEPMDMEFVEEKDKYSPFYARI